MTIFQKMNVQHSLFIALLRNQILNPRKSMRWEYRFLVCAVTAFFSYSLLNPLGKVILGREDEFLMLFFQGPFATFIALLCIIYGLIGFGYSVVSAYLFSTLFPKE